MRSPLPCTHSRDDPRCTQTHLWIYEWLHLAWVGHMPTSEETWAWCNLVRTSWEEGVIAWRRTKALILEQSEIDVEVRGGILLSCGSSSPIFSFHFFGNQVKWLSKGTIINARAKAFRFLPFCPVLSMVLPPPSWKPGMNQTQSFHNTWLPLKCLPKHCISY